MKEAEIRLDSSPSRYSERCGGCACVANGNQRERARRPDERSARGDARETPLSLTRTEKDTVKINKQERGKKKKKKTSNRAGFVLGRVSLLGKRIWR